jgi:hypothetical protein
MHLCLILPWGACNAVMLISLCVMYARVCVRTVASSPCCCKTARGCRSRLTTAPGSTRRPYQERLYATAVRCSSWSQAGRFSQPLIESSLGVTAAATLGGSRYRSFITHGLMRSFGPRRGETHAHAHAHTDARARTYTDAACIILITVCLFAACVICTPVLD